MIAPKNHFKQGSFVDREDHIRTFKENVYSIGQKKFSVLVYYGVAGIGKTSLRKELPKYLEKHNLEYRYRKTIWTSIDLRLDEHREKSTFLVTLKNDLQKEYKIHFPAFEIAHAIYWKKANPEIPLRKDNYLFFEGDNAFDDFFGVVDKIPYFSIVPATARLLKNLPDYFRKWWVNGEEELLQLSGKEPLEIEETLPYFWAQDLNNYLEHTSKSAVLFIDTHEALWENHRSDGHSRDEWIREEIIPRLPRKVLWVICGKEALKWKEIDSEWNEYLTQYKVEGLMENYCIKYLETRGITDNEIQEAIFKGSKGIPYYLELSADTYELIVKNNAEPKPEDFGDNYQKITDRFLRFLSPEEKNALNVLSIPHFWDYNLFEYLVKEFNIGYPTTNYEDLCSFSFIDKIENNRYQMHQLMQESLQKTQEKIKPDSVKRIHKILSEYYTNKLKNINIKAIAQEQETALTEAFYHAKESLKAEELFEWFISVSDPFYRAAFWQLIIPLYEEMLQILRAKLGKRHSHVATTTNNLAGFYSRMGEYEKALYFYQQSIKICEKLPEQEYPNLGITLSSLTCTYLHIGDFEKAQSTCEKAIEMIGMTRNPEFAEDVAITLNNLAELYREKGEFEKALPLYKKSLEIVENFLGYKHPSFAMISNNLALLQKERGYYKESLVLYEQALNIRKQTYGEKHPEVANSFNCLGDLYENMGEYKNALLFFEKALEIRESSLGKMHPEVANTLNNLAGLYLDLENYEKAIQLYEKALEIRESALGKKHYKVASTLNNLGLAYNYMGDRKKAFSFYRKALDIQKEKLGWITTKLQQH